MEHIDQGNVFTFGGVGGSITDLSDRFDDNHWEKFFNYCNRAAVVSEINLKGFWDNTCTLEGIDTKFAEWCLTYIVDCILYEEYMTKGNNPNMLLGYSLGLNTAMVCAGSIEFEDGIRLLLGIRECARESYQSGNLGMAIIVGLTKDNINTIINELSCSDYVKIASENTDSCYVISGQNTYIEKILDQSEKHGALRTRKLDVPYSFHFGSIDKEITKYLEIVGNMNIKDPKVPIISVYSQQILDSAELLKQEQDINVFMSMKWNQTIECLQDKGYQNFFDVSADGTLKKITILSGDNSVYYTYKHVLKRKQ